MQLGALIRQSIMARASVRFGFRTVDAILLIGVIGALLSVAWIENSFFFGAALATSAAVITVASFSCKDTFGLLKRNDDIFASLIYATFFSLLAVVVRDALGYMELTPFADIYTGEVPKELLSGGTAQSVYDKRDIKSLVWAFFFVFACSAVITQSLSSYMRVRFKSGKLSAFTPIVMLLLFACFTIYPPIRMDMTHWASWIGPAAGIGEWRFPYIHTHAQYGLMPAILIWAWLKAFGFTQMSLLLLVTVTSFTAGFALYYLVKKLTGSGLAGLVTTLILAFFYVSRDTYALFPNMGPIRSQLPTMAGLLLLWLSFSNRAGALVWSLLFGLVVLWEPVLGFLFFVSFLVSHGIKFLNGERASLKKIALCSISVFLPLTIMFLFRLPDYGPVTAIKNIFTQYASFSGGFAALPQVFPPEAIISFLFLLLALYILVKRVARKGLGLRDTHLFLLSSIIVSSMWVMYSMGRSVTPYFFPLLWATAPGIAFFAYIFIRAKKVRVYATSLIIVLLLTNESTYKRVFGGIEGMLTRYESERFDWYTLCADNMHKGANCDPETKPGYHTEVTKASVPLFKEDAGGAFKIRAIEAGHPVGISYLLPHPESPLIEACKAGIPMVSGLDSHIYMQHGCLPDHRFLSLSILTSKSDIEEFIRKIETHSTVAFDNRLIPHGLERMQDGIRKRLAADGFREYEKCGDISLLSNSNSPDWHCPKAEAFTAGSWKGDGEIINQNSGHMPARLIFDLPGDAPRYTVKANVRVDKGNTAGLVFNATDGLTYLVFYINTDSNTIELWEHNGSTEMERKNILSQTAKGVHLRKYDWNEIELRASNGKATFYINGVLQGHASVKTVRVQKTGLWTGATEAAFKDFTVIGN